MTEGIQGFLNFVWVIAFCLILGLIVGFIAKKSGSNTRNAKYYTGMTALIAFVIHLLIRL